MDYCIKYFLHLKLYLYSNSTSLDQFDDEEILNRSDNDTNLEISHNVIENVLGLIASSGNTFESIIVLIQRLSNLFLRIFDGLRFKYTWVKPEIDYVQCGANSLLQANFTSRHLTVMIKIFYEFLGFIKNVFGDGNINEISNNILSNFDDTPRSSEPSHQLKMAALYEASELMSNSGFIDCSKTYLVSFFVRFLELLYGDATPFYSEPINTR